MKKSIKQFLSEIGRKGGLVKSKIKSNAARLNGLKGGRPKKERENEQGIIRNRE